jgi:hypothetical protein
VAPDPVHLARHGRDGQAEHVRIGAGEHGYVIRHASATEHGAYSAGHTIQEAFVIEPAGR